MSTPNHLGTLAYTVDYFTFHNWTLKCMLNKHQIFTVSRAPVHGTKIAQGIVTSHSGLSPGQYTVVFTGTVNDINGLNGLTTTTQTRTVTIVANNTTSVEFGTDTLNDNN